MQQVVEFQQSSTTLCAGRGQWISCNVVPYFLGHRAFDLLQCTAALPTVSGPCNSLKQCQTAC